MVDFFAVDPLEKKYPFYTPYQFAGNKPIAAIDYEGLEPVFVHGTFSDPSTWGPSFKKYLSEALGYKESDAIGNFDWGGGNTNKARVNAANDLIKHITDPKNNLLAHEKHVTLIGHSHGGNVNKLAKKKLIDMGWTVDIINIETPQRTDYKTPKGNGLNISFYSEADLIQFLGSLTGLWGTPEFTLTTTGRVDPNAENFELDMTPDVNMSGRSSFEKPFMQAGKALEQFIETSGGHSLHNKWHTKWQIIDKVEKKFDKRREKVKKSKSKDKILNPRHF